MQFCAQFPFVTFSPNQHVELVTLSHSSLQTSLLESMQLEGEMVLLGGNLNLSLATQATTLVNSIPLAFTVANIPILVASLATNIWAIHIIQQKETSRINRFLIQIAKMITFFCTAMCSSGRSSLRYLYICRRNFFALHMLFVLPSH